MESSSVSTQCGVCRKTVDFNHFGGASCRACAAFFRRKVAGKQIPTRRCDGKCQLADGILKRLCQSCRFDKCLSIGMNPSLVLSRGHSKGSECSTTPKPRSILEQLNEAYNNLLSARTAAFQIKEGQVPKLCNYEEMNKIISIDNDLIIEHILSFFHKQEGMKEDYQKIFFPHFMTPFVLFESAFRSIDSPYLLIPNGDYVDVEQLDILYRHPNDTEGKREKRATTLFEPYWKLNKQSLKDNLKDVKLEVPEFLLLTALIYWDFGLQNQTDECTEMCKRKRTEIIEELTNYEKTTRRNEDYCLRIAEVLVVLQAVRRAFSLMLETREVSMIYDLYDTHCHLFELMKIS